MIAEDIIHVRIFSFHSCTIAHDIAMLRSTAKWMLISPRPPPSPPTCHPRSRYRLSIPNEPHFDVVVSERIMLCGPEIVTRLALAFPEDEG